MCIHIYFTLNDYMYVDNTTHQIDINYATESHFILKKFLDAILHFEYLLLHINFYFASAKYNICQTWHSSLVLLSRDVLTARSRDNAQSEGMYEKMRIPLAHALKWNWPFLFFKKWISKYNKITNDINCTHVHFANWSILIIIVNNILILYLFYELKEKYIICNHSQF